MNNLELKLIKNKALENHIPIIMDDTLEYIYKLYNNQKISSILEIGTAVGYSAICFTELLNKDGFIDTIERDEERIEEAQKNIVKAEVQDKINIISGDAVDILPNINKKIG